VRGAHLLAGDAVSCSLRCPGVAPGRPADAGRPALPAAHGATVAATAASALLTDGWPGCAGARDPRALVNAVVFTGVGLVGRAWVRRRLREEDRDQPPEE